MSTIAYSVVNLGRKSNRCSESMSNPDTFQTADSDDYLSILLIVDNSDIRRYELGSCSPQLLARGVTLATLKQFGKTSSAMHLLKSVVR